MNKRNFADFANSFNQKLAEIDKKLQLNLPATYQLMNPFSTGLALLLSKQFYNRFYADNKQRKLILGINPGRNGAGVTGIPFTDSKQLRILGINPQGIKTYELSAVFIYKVIKNYGGAKKFYSDFYFNSPLPLGLLTKNDKGNLINANYYDSKQLIMATKPLIDYAMQYYQKMPLQKNIVYCLGQGKNYQFLQKLNSQTNYFGRIIPLAHPRYVMQYKSKKTENYIENYLKRLTLK